MLANGEVVSRGVPSHLFAMSTVGQLVARTLMQRFVDSWNKHPIPGKGVPEAYIIERKNYPISTVMLPTEEAAVNMYRGTGRSLTDPIGPGVDPLLDHPHGRQQREVTFFGDVDSWFGGIESVANHTVNHNYEPLQRCIVRYIELGFML